MPAVHILGADRINADTAGHTTSYMDVMDQGSDIPNATSTERLDPEGFGTLFAGGIHPEAVPGALLTGLERATDSVAGAHGGLRPVYGSPLLPGPAGGAARARQLVQISIRNLFAAAKGTATHEPGT